MTTSWLKSTSELLTVAQMYRADAAAAESGVPTLDLMEAAGRAVADAVQERWPDGDVAVLCGPGNNGGDGFVAARLLVEAGRTVRVALLGEVESLEGDAAANAQRWNGDVQPLSPSAISGAGVVIDALFGAGLTRPLDGVVCETIDALNGSAVPCVAVDLPSGVNGDTGQVLGVAPQAAVTVTFFRRKPAHLLYPGRGLCGEVRVADIGIPTDVLEKLGAFVCENSLLLWKTEFPQLQPEGHKYQHGHAVVAGGAVLTGAARLASYAALRIGAGLVTIASPPAASAIYRAGRPTIMVQEVSDATSFGDLITQRKVSSALVGPGNGVDADTADKTLQALTHVPCVVDADALTVFTDRRDELFGALSAGDEGRHVLTPHEGEFARLFGTGENIGKIERAREAARTSNAVVLFKGADTVIAAPDGHAVINSNAPPYLSTAGSGDVLAGFIVGLIAQGMPTFESACAAAWLHGACADAFGVGLIADDIADMLPDVLSDLIQ